MKSFSRSLWPGRVLELVRLVKGFLEEWENGGAAVAVVKQARGCPCGCPFRHRHGDYTRFVLVVSREYRIIIPRLLCPVCVKTVAVRGGHDHARGRGTKAGGCRPILEGGARPADAAGWDAGGPLPPLFSVVAGLGTAAIEALVPPDLPVVRAMPNTSCGVREPAKALAVGSTRTWLTACPSRPFGPRRDTRGHRGGAVSSGPPAPAGTRPQAFWL